MQGSLSTVLTEYSGPKNFKVSLNFFTHNEINLLSVVSCFYYTLKGKENQNKKEWLNEA